MERACGVHGQEEKCIYGFRVELQTNRPLERFTHRLEGMFKIDLEEIRWRGADRFILLRGRTGCRLCELGTEPQVP
jgi:hypothetical protein